MTFQIFKRWAFVSLVVLSSQLLAGCTLTPSAANSVNTRPDSTHAIDYYLWLNTLSNQKLQLEHERLNEEVQQQDNDKHLTKVRLMLTHSVPHSPLYQPQRAIAQFQLLQAMTTERDDAFLSMLVKHLNTVVSLQHASEASAKTKQQLRKKLETQTTELNELKRQTQILQNQIDQLKQIESSINTNTHINRQ